MKNHATTYGFYYGAASIAFFLLFYVINPRMLFGTANTILGFALPVLFMYLSVGATREDQDGTISFGEALKASFLTYMIGSLIGILFLWVLYNYIDVSLLDLQKEMAIEMTENFVGALGASEENMEEMREALEEQGGHFSFGTAILGWLGSLIIPGIVIALILSAIMKNSKDNI